MASLCFISQQLWEFVLAALSTSVLTGWLNLCGECMGAQPGEDVGNIW